ncbi:hypothetical protein [Methylocaldum sp.]|uniref:hypothetical protein n=1 Tax=Methylocaldum sp. TaxID=1969727 RepID=UPI002D686648|nr:hypothetical protein [Methylocaldum sp.]HYE38244.1 hypothetical protein [Methylocaldum sp.]
MAARPLPEERLFRAKEIIEDLLRQGFSPPDLPVRGNGAHTEAAARLSAEFGSSEKTCWSWLRELGVRGRTDPRFAVDYTLFRPRQYLHRPAGAPVIPFHDHLAEPEPDGDPIRIAVIGDAHDAPHLRDKSRFRWLGQYIAEHGIPHVVQIGDWWTLDSFSSHTDRATFEGLAKPTFEQDRESFHESQHAFRQGLAGHKPKLDETLGNHELRAWRYSNFHPDGLNYGDLIVEAFNQWGFRVTPYGEFRFIGGVGFIHAPLQPASDKPYGGKTGGQRASNDSLFDIVRGDDHRVTISVGDKIGPVRAPTVYSTGTALPPGFIEGYARKGGSSWRSGICDLTIWGGVVRQFNFTDMHLLRRRYGALAA